MKPSLEQLLAEIRESYPHAQTGFSRAVNADGQFHYLILASTGEIVVRQETLEEFHLAVWAWWTGHKTMG